MEHTPATENLAYIPCPGLVEFLEHQGRVQLDKISDIREAEKKLKQISSLAWTTSQSFIVAYEISLNSQPVGICVVDANLYSETRPSAIHRRYYGIVPGASLPRRRSKRCPHPAQENILLAYDTCRGRTDGWEIPFE